MASKIQTLNEPSRILVMSYRMSLLKMKALWPSANPQRIGSG